MEGTTPALRQGCGARGQFRLSLVCGRAIKCMASSFQFGNLLSPCFKFRQILGWGTAKASVCREHSLMFSDALPLGSGYILTDTASDVILVQKTERRCIDTLTKVSQIQVEL